MHICQIITPINYFIPGSNKVDYFSMSKKELIQEVIKLRTKLEHHQGNEFIETDNIKQSEIIRTSLQDFQTELFIRVSPELKYIYVNLVI